MTHIFSVRPQKATRFRVDVGNSKPFWVTLSPHARRHCYDCGRLRTTRNLFICVYYDCSRFFCVEGHDVKRGKYVTKRVMAKGNAGEEAMKLLTSRKRICGARKRFYIGDEGYWRVCNRPHGHRGEHRSMYSEIEPAWPRERRTNTAKKGGR